MPLTDVACRNAKPRAKLYKLSDFGGLCLRVTPTGGKYWVLRYRLDKKQKELSLGVYPTVSLLDARAAREDAKRLLREGGDPAIAKLTQRINASIERAGTFADVASDWFKTKSNRLSDRYAGQIKARLEADIFPDLGKLPINSVTPPQLLRSLKKVQGRGAIETAHRLKQYCSMVFRYGIASGLVERDPAADLKDALITGKTESHAAIDASDLPELLKKMADPTIGMGVQTRLAMRFLMLTFVRTTEMTEATWGEFDLTKKIWTIPATRMKMDRDHLVPLARQTCEILGTMRKLSSSEFVFPGHRSLKEPMSNMAILMGLRKMGYKGRMTGHGFRALAMTTLREVLDYPFDVIDLQLAHAPRSKVRAAYDRAKFIKQRTEMMQAWADYLDEVDPVKS
jgi:integrase